MERNITQSQSTQPTQELNYIISPWSFATWGIDLIRLINLHSWEDHKFFITTTKLTTKWVEVIPMKLVTQDKIIAFLTKNIITRFEVPQRLIMDNVPKFKGKEMKAFCKNFILFKRFLQFTILKVMVMKKLLTRLSKVFFPKLGRDTNGIGMNSYHMYLGHIE